MPYTPKDITLYIPCYRVEATLEAVLNAVRQQTIQPARILLIDDGSPVPVPKFPDVTVIRHPSNKGLAAGRNTALQHCDTKLIAALDADVVPDPDWLEQLLNAIRLSDYAGVGGRMDEKFDTGIANGWRATHMYQHWGEAPKENPRFLYGADTLFSTEALRDVGGYDVRHHTNDEDRAISDTLYDHGYHLFYTPAAHCLHLRQDDIQSILTGYWRWHYTRGVLRGDFDQAQTITIPRMELVNFGIYHYRYDTDEKAGRNQFLALDSCIPWVFCALDLLHFAMRNQQAIPPFPNPLLLDKLRPEVAAFISSLMPKNLKDHIDTVDWAQDYYNEFERLLTAEDWYAQSHDRKDLWKLLLEN